MRTLVRRLVRFTVLAGIASFVAKLAQQANEKKAAPAAASDFPDVPKKD